MVEVGGISRRILRELCMDSRVTITELSENLGYSRPIISRHIEAMERELGIKYTLDLNHRELRLGDMVVYHVSFRHDPPESFIQDYLDKSSMVQLAVKTKNNGVKDRSFELVMFVLASNDEEFAKWNLNIGLKFSDYGVTVSKSNMDIIHHGFIPLNKDIIESARIDDVYKKLLVALNENSRATVRSLAKDLKMNEEMVRYYMGKLTKLNYVRRHTAVLTGQQQGASVMFFARYTYAKGAINRIIEKRKVYFKKELDMPVYNDWQMVSSLSGAADEFEWAMAPTEKQAIDDRLKLHERMFKSDSPNISWGIVEKVYKGVLPIRSVDIKKLYNTTEWVPGQNYKGD